MFKKVFTFSLFLLVGLFLVSPGTAISQEQGQKSAEQMKAEMEVAMQGMQQMGPTMGEMMGQMMDSMLSYLSKKETSVKLATFTRNYYVALVKNGFTKEEALQIVVQSGIPTLGK